MRMTGKVLFTTKTLSSLRYYRVFYLNTFLKSSVFSVYSVVKSIDLSFRGVVKFLSLIMNKFLSFNKLKKSSVLSVCSVVKSIDLSFNSNLSLNG